MEMSFKNELSPNRSFLFSVSAIIDTDRTEEFFVGVNDNVDLKKVTFSDAIYIQSRHK